MGQLKDRMRSRYDNLFDFVKRSDLSVSMETARKLIYREEPVTCFALIAITHALGYSRSEIKSFLKSRYLISAPQEKAMAALFSSLVDDEPEGALTADEKRILRAFGSLTTISAERQRCLRDMLLMVAEAEALGPEIEKDFIAIFKRK